MTPHQAPDTTGLPLFETRDAALDALEIAREHYVQAARKLAHELLDARPSITINDIREQLPPPKDVDPRVMGAILRAPHFKRIGYTSSDRSACHARPIAVFVRGEYRSNVVLGQAEVAA